MTFALETEADGINLDTVGIILMIVGAVGLLFSTIVLSSWRSRRAGDRTVIREEREVL